MTDTANTTFADAPAAPTAAAARDFVLRATKTAKERVESLHQGAEKATATLESALNTSATTVAEVARAMQGAIYSDVEATLATVEKMASARSLAEAAQFHVEFLSRRGQVGLDRMKSATEYVGQAMQNAAKTAQDSIAKMTERTSKAA